ncbi:hypothetical protein [Gordonia hydrophobica]|uniref:Integral membrane protein n=1 Tax=Gordonia hydrophobica TaxID=40516 RepID=A0ABZ2U2C2_9ACTN|nr:hypothetical protein [Gordonia hydrophobica]MBM7366827.1 CBS-domain-containing membrane protein [Gordonia hydrophobica]
MTAGERIELVVLAVSGLILGIMTAAFLGIYVGGVPLPVTAVIAGAVNVVLYVLAASLTASAWQFAPLGAWTLVTVLAMLPLFGNGSLIGDWRLLLLLACGLGIPAYYASTRRLKAITSGASDRP